MKKFSIFLTVLCGFGLLHSQVGINTTDPNKATVLDIHSEEKGILIPRLTDAQRDSKLADNDPATIPPIGVVNTNLTEGTLIYNTTVNRFEFWDGKVWRQLFVATSSAAGNDGVVRIDGGAGGARPTMSLAGPTGGATWGVEKEITYNVTSTAGLTFAPNPTTSWPETVGPVPDGMGTEFIYVKQPTKGWQFIENPIPGQVHIWRLVVELSTGSSSSGAVQARLYNPNPPSSFQINSVQYLPSKSQAGNILTFYFYTIADDLSIGNDKGYKIALSTQNDITLTVRSLTRVSLFKD